jgi:hypothetical protein
MILSVTGWIVVVFDVVPWRFAYGAGVLKDIKERNVLLMICNPGS